MATCPLAHNLKQLYEAIKGLAGPHAGRSPLSGDSWRPCGGTHERQPREMTPPSGAHGKGFRQLRDTAPMQSAGSVDPKVSV
jgi:hypothetical protein